MIAEQKKRFREARAIVDKGIASLEGELAKLRGDDHVASDGFASARRANRQTNTLLEVKSRVQRLIHAFCNLQCCVSETVRYRRQTHHHESHRRLRTCAERSHPRSRLGSEIR